MPAIFSASTHIPYFQVTEANPIDAAYEFFFQAYNDTAGVSGGKPVWITETGWPVSGPNENLAVPSIQNAQTYWDQVGCAIFGKYNAWWYTLQDSYPTTPAPALALSAQQLSTTPLFNLTCPSAPPPSLTFGACHTTAHSYCFSSTTHIGAVSKAKIDSGVMAAVIAIAALVFQGF